MAPMSKPGDVFQLLQGGVDEHREGVDSSGTVGSGQSEQALLEAGKISVEEFMEMTVDRALAHLQGDLDTERMQAMREILLGELEQEPNLQALVQRIANK